MKAIGLVEQVLQSVDRLAFPPKAKPKTKKRRNRDKGARFSAR